MEKSVKVVSYVIGLFAVVFLITQLTSMKFENLKQKNGLSQYCPGGDKHF